jgi:anti-sigma28 factor (negative regulator of flagellin synthesis)
MKVSPKSLESQAEIIQLDRQTQVDQLKAKLAKERGANKQDGAANDKVEVSKLAAALNGEFSPFQMVSERQSKIDKIKEQLASGTYRPSSEDVAKALADEISTEILSSGGLLQADN